MVNITKRMHKLMPKLWRVKGGAGAAIIPPRPPKPQLTSVVLRIPNPANGYDNGAHTFWRKFLPALRYHNLTLPIQVEQKVGADVSFSPTLTLQFQATTREALEKQVTQPKHSDDEALNMAKRALEERRAAEKREEVEGGSIVKKKENTWVDQMRRQQEEEGTPEGRGTHVGEITIKPQAAADPSAPSTTSPPVTLYQRSVTLGLRGRYAMDIWSWFQTITAARPYGRSRQDKKRMLAQKKHNERADIDRARVKAGIDAMKRERDELKRAREAAERLQSEV